MMDSFMKYDRQVRIWGQNGQDSLEKANICVIGATGLGCETLKNLILPGINSFTLVDSQITTISDVESNFFLDAACVGQIRSTAVLKNLLELNEDVTGDCCSTTDLLNFCDEKLQQYDVFILDVSSNVLEYKNMKNFCSRLWHLNIPFYCIRVHGEIGSVQPCFKEIAIIETHSDYYPLDLRLTNPFPQLLEALDSIPDFDLMNDEEFSHVPWPFLIIRCLPFKNINDMKQKLRSLSRGKNELNIEEALQNSAKVSAFSGLPSDSLTALLNDSSLIDDENSDFWILIKALREFLEFNKGYLPLRDAVPDMHSSTEYFVKLQQAFKAKANEDTDSMLNIANRLAMNKRTFSKELIKTFCRNATNLKVLRGFDFNHTPQNVTLQVLKAFDLFRDKWNKEPDCNADIPFIKSCLLDINSDYIINSDVIVKVLRNYGVKINCVCTWVGSATAHEIIKILTKQFIPLTSALLFDASLCTTEICE